MKTVKNFNKLLEWSSRDLEPIKSLMPKSELDQTIWWRNSLRVDISKQLLEIGEDFYKSSDISAPVIDIVLCGSICNYNWSKKYSDFDIHVIIDFKKVSSDIELVNSLVDLTKKLWNIKNDIIISGYPVEVAIQDHVDLRTSMSGGQMGGVWSLISGKWLQEPEKIDIQLDSEDLEGVAIEIMGEIDAISKRVKSGKYIYDSVSDDLKSVWSKIKKLRKSSLSRDGEWGSGNLVFKLLRRNGYIQKIIDLKKVTYEKKFK